MAEESFWGLVHPAILRVAKGRFEDQYYADAVLAALIFVNNRVKAAVREKTGKEWDGADLMNRAFSIQNPVIPLDDLGTTTGRDIQQGYMQIFAGAMTGIRNPKAHEIIEISPERALHFLVLASLLMSKLDEAMQVAPLSEEPAQKKEPRGREGPRITVEADTTWFELELVTSEPPYKDEEEKKFEFMYGPLTLGPIEVYGILGARLYANFLVTNGGATTAISKVEIFLGKGALVRCKPVLLEGFRVEPHLPRTLRVTAGPERTEPLVGWAEMEYNLQGGDFPRILGRAAFSDTHGGSHECVFEARVSFRTPLRDTEQHGGRKEESS